MNRPRFLIVILALVSLNTIALTQSKKDSDELTLAEARTALVGKTIVIVAKSAQAFKGYLHDWKLVLEFGGEYRENRESIMNYLSDTYQAKGAQVVAIQLNSIERERSGAGGVNALGEQTSEDALVNPYVDVVIRFPDGMLAMTTTYVSIIFSDSDLVRPFKLLSEKRDRGNLINSQLASIVGKTVYAVGYSHLFMPTASLEALMESARYSQQQAFDFPRLQPLTIAKAAYNDEKDVIILKLKDANGKEYLCLSNFDSRDDKATFLTRVVQSFPASLHASMPSDLTPREIEAIRKGSIFRGMSKDAVYYTIGFPEKDNDWGRGGKQFIYFHGTMYVYIDATEHVTDWQSIKR